MRINGKKVIDAQAPLHITISPRDAAQGKSRDPGKCAAARAIIRTVTDAKSARVHLGRTYVEFGDVWVRYKTPVSLKTEIVSFDRGTNPQHTVGDYTLSAPSPTDRIGARTENKKAGKTSGKRSGPTLLGFITKSKACGLMEPTAKCLTG